MSLPPINDRETAQERLTLIFPPAAFDTVLANALAAAAITAMLYVGAVVDDDVSLSDEQRFVRPSTCLWLQPETLARASDDERRQWHAAAVSHGKAKERVEELTASWGLAFRQPYADNTRETLRDETWPAWAERGAARKRSDIPTTSDRARWALTASFAALFDPALGGQALIDAIDHWRSTHMSPTDLLRITTNADTEAREHAVLVTLPNGDHRRLSTGVASEILKGIIEEWAPRRLHQPVVLTVSEPGDKVFVADAAVLGRLGITIDPSGVLPDALIVDIGVQPPLVWVIEAVATDGPVTESRKTALKQWASDQRIDPSTLRFVSAFRSRNAGPAKRRLKDLAVDTTAWFLDEPERELSWREIAQTS